jgi:hypothetical protein
LGGDHDNITAHLVAEMWSVRAGTAIVDKNRYRKADTRVLADAGAETATPRPSKIFAPSAYEYPGSGPRRGAVPDRPAPALLGSLWTRPAGTRRVVLAGAVDGADHKLAPDEVRKHYSGAAHVECFRMLFGICQASCGRRLVQGNPSCLTGFAETA